MSKKRPVDRKPDLSRDLYAYAKQVWKWRQALQAGDMAAVRRAMAACKRIGKKNAKANPAPKSP
jgi:hypothetical protein